MKNSIIATSVQNYSYAGTDFGPLANGENAYIWSIANVVDSFTPVINCAWKTDGGKIGTSTNWIDCMDLNQQPQDRLQATVSGTNNWGAIVRLDGKRAYVDKSNLNDVKVMWALNNN